MTHAFVRTLAPAAAAAALLTCGAALVAAGQERGSTAVFTAEQADAGKTAYGRSCASCHMHDLSGNNEMPALAGTTFVATWRDRSTKELFDYIAASMPYGGPSLSTEAYESITAYILRHNGAAAGGQALRGSTDVPIRSVLPE